MPGNATDTTVDHACSARATWDSCSTVSGRSRPTAASNCPTASRSSSTSCRSRPSSDPRRWPTPTRTRWSSRSSSGRSAAADRRRRPLHQGPAGRELRSGPAAATFPAWLPVQDSKAFLTLKPQSNYVKAAFNAVYDPVAWYTGAGSDFQNSMGAVITNVLAGSTSPKARRQRDEALAEDVHHRPPPVR